MCCLGCKPVNGHLDPTATAMHARVRRLTLWIIWIRRRGRRENSCWYGVGPSVRQTEDVANVVWSEMRWDKVCLQANAAAPVHWHGASERVACHPALHAARIELKFKFKFKRMRSTAVCSTQIEETQRWRRDHRVSPSFAWIVSHHTPRSITATFIFAPSLRNRGPMAQEWHIDATLPAARHRRPTFA